MVLTEKSLQNAYIGENVQPRTPGANTIAYFPFTDDMLDATGSISMSSYGNVSLTTAPGSIGRNALYVNTGSLDSAYSNSVDDLTVLGYFYQTSAPTNDNGNVFGFGRDSGINGGEPLCMINYARTRPNWITNKPGISLWDDNDQASGTPAHTISNNTRYHLGATLNRSSGLACLYINGVLVDYYTAYSKNKACTGIHISRDKDLNRSIKGYMGNVIFEKKERTGTEMANYFSQTKSEFGL